MSQQRAALKAQHTPQNTAPAALPERTSEGPSTLPHGMVGVRPVPDVGTHLSLFNQPTRYQRPDQQGWMHLLQKHYGNRYVGQVVHQARHRRASSAPIQAKLTLGPIDDPYEREADRIAHDVVQRLSVPAPPPDEATPTNYAPPTIVMRTGKSPATTTDEALPHGLEHRIEQARSSGRPLPDGVRGAMERAFSVDFDGVRIHTDDRADHLNHSIQARAFTTGRDIFFRQGEYQPYSRNGQELLAHELTHVVQQNGSGTKRPQAPPAAGKEVVQRKIGFEFQAFDNAYFYEEGDPEKKPVDVFDKVTMGQGPGYEVQSDGGKTPGELELQTDAFDETTAGRERLKTTMENITAFLAPLDHRDVSLSNFNGGGYNHAAPGRQYQHQMRLNAVKGLAFHPQATVGVRLQNLEALMVALTNAPVRGEQERRYEIKTALPPRVAEAQPYADQLGWSQAPSQQPFQQTMQAAHKPIEEHFSGATANLRSFVFLVASYVQGSEVRIPAGVEPYDAFAKYFMTLMARSSLDYIFQKVLNEQERQLFLEQLEHIPDISAELFRQAKESSDAYDNVEEFLQEGDEFDFKTWLKHLGDKDLLRMAWIQGYGELYEKTGAVEHELDEKYARYGIESPSDIGIDESGQKRLDGILVELRKLGADVDLHRLGTFALAAFDLVRAVHGYANDQPDGPPPAKRARPDAGYPVPFASIEEAMARIPQDQWQAMFAHLPL